MALKMPKKLYKPQLLDWMKGYSPSIFGDDLLAAVIVTILLVPQALAYAMLAGLPAQVGIYAAIFPLIIYALVGTSRHLSMGPTAVVSLMTAVAIAGLPEETRIVGAAVLALISGWLLIIFGLLRTGFIMNFVSRPVVSAYVTGAAILIIFSQLKHVLGVTGGGSTVLELGKTIYNNLANVNTVALMVGGGTIVFLFLVKRYLAALLERLRVNSTLANMLSRLGPFVVVIVTSILAYRLDLHENYGLNIVGEIPSGLPRFAVPEVTLPLVKELFAAAALISVVGFVDSMSTAQTLAAKARNRISSNREMRALGYCNMTAGFFGGYPINGSMSRSAVNFSAGAKTPAASIITAAFMCLAAVYLTPYLRFLPLATLAGLIVFACFSLLDFKHLWLTYKYSAADGITAILTFFAVLIFGVQLAVLFGVVVSMALHIRSTLKPHAVLVGRFPGTEHYRDASRFDVETSEIVKTLRIDESLYFANARFLEDHVADLVQKSPEMSDLILMCPAVNSIDASALNSLMSINKRLKLAGVNLHMSELHTAVADRLGRSSFFSQLTGQVFFSQHEAMDALEPEPDWQRFFDHVDMH